MLCAAASLLPVSSYGLGLALPDIPIFNRDGSGQHRAPARPTVLTGANT
jgi:hypothetical protein